MMDSRCSAGAVDLVQRSACSGVASGAPQEVGEADDGVHRRADLVAHVGEEGALGLVGGLGPLPRLGQLRGAARHQFLQVVTVAVQFLAEALLLGDVFLHRDVVA